jgi:hypothetical protein
LAKWYNFLSKKARGNPLGLGRGGGKAEKEGSKGILSHIQATRTEEAESTTT